MSPMVLSDCEIDLLSNGHMTQDAVSYFRQKYGNRFVRALRAVEEDRVKQYIFQPSMTSMWIVSGRRRDYMVIPDIYCNCRSFYQDVVIARTSDFCYHLLAQEIAQIWNRYELIKSTDAERRQLFVNSRRTD